MSTVIANIDSFLWGLPFVFFVLIVGAYYFIRSGAFPLRHFHHIMKNTAGHMMSAEAKKKEKGHERPSGPREVYYYEFNQQLPQFNEWCRGKFKR